MIETDVDLIGKTIQYVKREDDETIVMRFTDDTYIEITGEYVSIKTTKQVEVTTTANVDVILI